VRGTETARQLELRGHDVDRNDLGRAGQHAALHAGEPDAPRPKTAIAAPVSTRARFSTAPTPVMTPQPISAARSNGTRASIGIAALLADDRVLTNLTRSQTDTRVLHPM